jgi:hypothetical protein
MGIAVDASGIYVADQNNQRIQKFSSTGNFITKWGSLGSQDGQFNNPGYIALDATGNLYVEDQTNQRIQKFSSAGAFITKWGSAGNDDGQFANPNGIAVDSAGNVYVSDLYHYRIQKFSSTGAFITKWGSQGSGDGQFNYPQGIATDQYGYVYVADVNNHRVQKFTSTGAFVTKWGSSGSGDGQFNSPRAVTVDSANKVHVVDFYNYRIQVFGVHTPPIVATDAATSVGSSTATLNGNLNAMGTTTTVNVSFEYGATTSYGTATTAQARTTTGTFSAAITGLSGNTTYHYRAKADGGAAGTANGADTTFTTLAGLVSETSATAVSDVDGIIRISANINRVKDPSTGQTAVLPGGLGSFSFSVSTAPSNSATFATTAIALASSQSSWNPNTGIFTVSGILNPAQPNSSSVARIAPRLVGDCITPVTITIAFQNITGAGGSSAPEESPNSLSFRRGDVNGNGTVDIFDAMYIAQYIVGVRPASQINFVNAACIKHDGTDGDKLDIFDAMYIAQMVVGLRNNRFE